MDDHSLTLADIAKDDIYHHLTQVEIFRNVHNLLVEQLCVFFEGNPRESHLAVLGPGRTAQPYVSENLPLHRWIDQGNHVWLVDNDLEILIEAEATLTNHFGDQSARRNESIHYKHHDLKKGIPFLNSGE